MQHATMLHRWISPLKKPRQSLQRLGEDVRWSGPRNALFICESASTSQFRLNSRAIRGKAPEKRQLKGVRLMGTRPKQMTAHLGAVFGRRLGQPRSGRARRPGKPLADPGEPAHPTGLSAIKRTRDRRGCQPTRKPPAVGPAHTPLARPNPVGRGPSTPPGERRQS